MKAWEQIEEQLRMLVGAAEPDKPGTVRGVQKVSTVQGSRGQVVATVSSESEPRVKRSDVQ